jgi:hypothetical protein
MTAEGVALLDTSVVTFGLRRRTSAIFFHAPDIDSSGCATRSIDGFSNECEPGLRDSMSEESVGVYEGMYKPEKYNLTEPSDRIGPMACRG